MKSEKFENPGTKFDNLFGGSEFDLRQSKLNSLGKLVDALNQCHVFGIAGDQPGTEGSKTWWRKGMAGILEALFYEARMYSDNEELIQEIEQMFQKVGNPPKMNDLKPLRLKVHQLMQDANLDLPREIKKEPGREMME